MNIETVTAGPFETNGYVAWDEALEALILDPGAEAGRFADVIESRGLRVAAYLVTHGHCDHIGAIAAMVKAHPAPVGISLEDARWAFLPANQLPPYYPTPKSPPKIDRILEDGQEWTDGGMTYRVIATPGHSPGGVSFYFPAEGVLFSGDTLFQGSVGRTDIPGGDPRLLSASLKKIAALPGDTRVYPGHGAATTIGMEKKTNFFLRR